MIRFKNFKKIKIPRSLPFGKAERSVLGGRYELEVVFISSLNMKNLNKTYRQKNKSTNVLSFALDDSHGQIFFDPVLIKKEVVKERTAFKSRLWFLFLHGLLHLAGYEHEGSLKAAQEMNKAESSLLKKYPV